MRTPWLFLPLVFAASPVHAQAVHSTSDTKWGPPPPFLPAGAQAGVVTGTLLGERLLFGLSADRFRRLIAVLIGLVGVLLLTQAL